MHVSRHVKSAVAIAALMIAGPATAAAQQASTTRFGLSAGLDIPLSDLSNNAQTGYVINGLAEGTPQGWPVALRGELSYASFGGSHGYVSQNVTALNVDAVLPLTTATDQAGYFLGGIGLNHTSAFAGLQSENDFGFNFGGGYRWQLSDMDSFVELRYVYVAHSSFSWQMLPLTFGVKF